VLQQALSDSLVGLLALPGPALDDAVRLRGELSLVVSGLAEVDHAYRQMLVHTLDSWVSTAGSTIRTAEALHCHRNTATNRMHRIESVIGYAFTADDIPLELPLNSTPVIRLAAATGVVVPNAQRG
jgi:hypothetical protein